MDMKALLARYASSKTNPPPARANIPESKPMHPLHEQLAVIRRTEGNCHSLASHSGEENLGILFIIIDEFPNEVLWRLWLDQFGCTEGEPSKVQIWFHAKFPNRITSPWVRERLVKSFHFRPEWGSLELTKVMVHMLHEATTVAPHINKFCFASESCIPIVPLKDTLARIYAPPKSASVSSSTDDKDYHSSWLAYRDTANNGYATRDQFGPLERCLPEGCIYKASQWVLLSRTHALAVLGLLQRFQGTVSKPLDPSVPPLGEELFSVFGKGVRASDEMFFPCCLAVLGYINPPREIITLDTNEGKEMIENVSGGSMPIGADGANCGGCSSSEKRRCCEGQAAVVLQRQLTYSDWRGQAANPIEFKTFPSQLVQEISAGSSHAGNSMGSGVGSKRTVHGGAKQVDDELGPAVEEAQRGAVFLRKIKFPRGTSAVGGSGGTGTGGVGVGELTTEQQAFLEAWVNSVYGSVEISKEGWRAEWAASAIEILADTKCS